MKLTLDAVFDGATAWAFCLDEHGHVAGFM
jgi:hypothetical protein